MSLAVAARIAILLPVCLTVATPAMAQHSALEFEVRGGISVPTGDPVGEGDELVSRTGPGGSLGAAFALTLRERVVIVAGFSQRRLSCDAGLCAEGREIRINSLEAGLRLVLARRRVRPWIGAELRSELAGIPLATGGERLSDRAPGWGLSAGASLRLADRWGLRPLVRYLVTDLELDPASTTELRPLSAELGLVLIF